MLLDPVLFLVILVCADEYRILPPKCSNGAASLQKRGSKTETKGLLEALFPRICFPELALRRSDQVRPQDLVSYLKVAGGPLVVSAAPGLIGIVSFHLLGNVYRIRPQIFLIDHSIAAYDKRLHTRHTILGRDGDESEPADHQSFDDVV